MHEADHFEQKEAQLRAQEIEFLTSRSPDDWHRYALNYNWDDGISALRWIVSQPMCDLATALLIFWRGEPTGYDYETAEPAMDDDIYAVAAMLRYIAERFNTSGYPRAEIAYDFLDAAGYSAGSQYASAIEAGRLRDIEALVERQKNLANARVKLHPDLTLLQVPGRNVGGYDPETGTFDLCILEDDAADDAPTEPEWSSIVDASARIRAIRHQADASGEDTSDAKSASGLPGWLKGLFRR
ncbi:MAG: DUF4274 domain-containing protein [Sphingomonas sp.]|nr:DUF4274 domain-containing protein [Sphingomonas sp.]